MIVSLLYKVTSKLLSAASVLLGGEAAKDAELLVLRHENTVLRRQLVGPIRYEPADRFSTTTGALLENCPTARSVPGRNRFALNEGAEVAPWGAKGPPRPACPE